MSNIIGNVTALAVTTLGIVGMSPDDFKPTTIFVYLILIFVTAFIVSFYVEVQQPAANKKLHTFMYKIKLKFNAFFRMGQRHI